MIFKIFATHVYIVEKYLFLKYLNHLRYLKTKQEKREQKKSFEKNKIKNHSVVLLGRADL